jgi:pimeloyl-ACP methyl ester carboxylesterase
MTANSGAKITDGMAAGLHYLQRAGDPRAAIVLLHGIGSRAASFEAMLARYPEGPLLLAWDAPGYGGSAPLADQAPQAADYAARLNDLLTALKLDRVAVVGHSLGCLMAGAFAAHVPDRLSSVAFISPALGYGNDPANAHRATDRIADLERLGPERFAAERAAKLVADPQAQPDVVAQVRAAMAAVHSAGYAQAARMLGQGRLLDDAARIAVPAAVIVGDRDAITPPERAERLADALRAGARGAATRLVTIRSAGHAVCQEQPDAVIAALTDFFSSIPAQEAVA